VIPRIVHQTWKSTSVPAEWREAHRSWHCHHPGWELRLWTDEANRELVASRHPTLLDRYDSLPYPILRADVARVLILERWGGVYADLDVECLRPFDSLLAGSSMVLGFEPAAHARRLGRRTLVSNAVIAAVPGHPLLHRLIETFHRLPADILTHRDVLEQTGPLQLSRVLEAAPGLAVEVTAPEVFSPLRSDDPALAVLRERRPGFDDVQRDCKRRGAYAVHYWSNSWMGTLAGTLHNPAPADVPGFRFHPGLDSAGYDIANGGREIPALARACLANPDALGFNTDGFLKGRIRPRSDWQPMVGPPGVSGLYVKEGVTIVDAPPGSRLARRWRRWMRALRRSAGEGR
jgi:hypothetical protein